MIRMGGILCFMETEKDTINDTQNTKFVTYDEFKKMDIRVGKVMSVEPVEGADKLLKFMLDFNEVTDDGSPKQRQIVSGIREYYPEYEKLIGKQLLYIVNLEPRTIRGVESHGMLLAVDGRVTSPEGGDMPPVFLVPEIEVTPGVKVR